MQNQLRKLLTVIGVGTALLFAPAAAPAAVSAMDLDARECLLRGSWMLLRCDDPTPTPSTGLEDVIVRLVQLFSAIIGIVAVIMIIFGGFRYVTSGGDTGNVVAAKNTIIYAIVGLIVVALAQLIVRFVVENITSL